MLCGAEQSWRKLFASHGCPKRSGTVGWLVGRSPPSCSVIIINIYDRCYRREAGHRWLFCCIRLQSSTQTKAKRVRLRKKQYVLEASGPEIQTAAVQPCNAQHAISLTNLHRHEPQGDSVVASHRVHGEPFFASPGVVVVVDVVLSSPMIVSLALRGHHYFVVNALVWYRPITDQPMACFCR